jgi:hypothetical protein
MVLSKVITLSSVYCSWNVNWMKRVPLRALDLCSVKWNRSLNVLEKKYFCFEQKLQNCSNGKTAINQVFILFPEITYSEMAA